MAMIFTGRKGKLRITDGTFNTADGAEANMNCEVYDASGPTFTDKTSEAYSDDASSTGTFFVDTGDKVYIGQKTTFACIKFLSGEGALAVGAGALTVKYYNGSSFITISKVNDGTASGGNTFAQDGYIDFEVPGDWAKQGDDDLDSDKYYIELSTENVPGTAPDADILAPGSGYYFDVSFSMMDFNGPIGRGMTEEMLILDRGTMDSKGHYIEGDDSPVYEPLDISWSCTLDDTYNKEDIEAALTCGNPGTTEWGSTGTTTKGDSKNDGTNYNPTFDDSSKKTVDIQIKFENSSGSYIQGFAYYETYFPQEGVQISESADGVTLSATGAVYGVVERIGGLGKRYY